MLNMYRREKIKGYERYEVDTNGVVYSQKGNPLKFHVNHNGYCMVCLCTNGETKGFGIHQLVARQFIENDDPLNKTQVNHKDGNKQNNHVENLEWATAKENMRHSVDILGNYLEDKNANARTIYGVDIKTHEVKYRFTSLIGAARFFTDDKNKERHIQATLWRVLNHYEASRSYRSCLWFYEDECPYEINDVVNLSDNYIPDRGFRKLSDDDVKWIRTHYIPYDNEFGTRGVARRFHIDNSTVSDIVNYKTYTDIC